MKITNPADGTVITEITADNAAAVRRKYELARAGQRKWAKVPIRKRLAAISAFRERIVAMHETLARTLTHEVGKPIRQSRNELNGLLGRLDFFLEESAGALRDEKVHADAAQNLEERITHEPLGVVANISAWNYPYFVGSNVFVPALVAGNAVLYKPSEFATLTGTAHRRDAARGRCPARRVRAGDRRRRDRRCVAAAADRRRVLHRLLRDRSEDRRSRRQADDQGSARARRQGSDLRLRRRRYRRPPPPESPTAPSTIPGSRAARSSASTCTNRSTTGSSMLSSPRSRATGSAIRWTKATYIGAITRRPQLDVLKKQVADAKRKGAKLLLGGNIVKRKGNWFEPTVFIDVDHSMALMKDESFGPIIGIQSVADDAAAVDLMNDTEYGLTAGVYTNDAKRARRILGQLRAGSVYWNCCDRVSPRLPWSGVGHSGIGLTLSTYGIQTFTRPKAWHLRSA